MSNIQKLGTKKMKKIRLILILLIFCANTQGQRLIQDFNKGWKFHLGDNIANFKVLYSDANWRTLDLPHDWSIEGKFDSTHPSGNAGGALPGGMGWYRKVFTIPEAIANKKIYIEFDGVYRNSAVWINEHYLGKWPYGYTSFRYDLTPYIKTGNEKNLIAVRVDNSQQPNSRWYTGSGIYRDVRLVITSTTAICQWGLFITTPQVTKFSANVNIKIKLDAVNNVPVTIHSKIFDAKGNLVSQSLTPNFQVNEVLKQNLQIKNPILWSVKNPYLYKLVTTIYQNNKLADKDTSAFGIRTFNFDAEKGFSLNGKAMKILGVCMHHDLGALGAAFNKSAARRQLQLLKNMGCNAIRVSHNPPAPQFLDLCDEMGFLVMDESFDMWVKQKNPYDYHLDFEDWHQKDLEAMVLRDRNHPSVFMWSIGNEIPEQFDSTGITIGKKLVKIVKQLDPTRPVTCALSENRPERNFIYQSKALDVVGLNYHIDAYEHFPKNYPGEKFIATENVSGLASRGQYDMPVDSLRLWPPSSKFKYVPEGNADYSVSAYDNVAAYWGSTHEQTWRIIKSHDFISGYFVWSGFDFIGEPIPYPYPARSSYYGIIDLAGFPKDVYYMYQSEWTDNPVLHLFPHWNWSPGQMVDVKAYYNNADEAELFINGRSLGIRRKSDTAFHVLWHVPYEAGELKAVSRKNGKPVLEKVTHTAGEPYKIELSADKHSINLENDELAFITIRIVDKKGNLVPQASNMVNINTSVHAKVAGMDNGYQADLNSMKDEQHNVYHGIAAAIIKGKKRGTAIIECSSKGLKKAQVAIKIF